jgi:hypothetical protein
VTPRLSASKDCDPSDHLAAAGPTTSARAVGHSIQEGRVDAQARCPATLRLFARDADDLSGKGNLEEDGPVRQTMGAWYRAFSCPREEPRLPISLGLLEDVERGERCREFTGTHAKPTGTDVDSARRSKGQDPTPCKPFDDLLVEPGIPEEIAQDDIDRRPVGEAAVKIDNVEPAAVTNTAQFRQFAGKADRDRGHVDSPDLQPALRQPHGTASSSARELQGLSIGRKQVLVRTEQIRDFDADRSRSDPGVPCIPMDAVPLGHIPTIRAPSDECSEGDERPPPDPYFYQAGYPQVSETAESPQNVPSTWALAGWQ